MCWLQYKIIAPLRLSLSSQAQGQAMLSFYGVDMKGHQVFCVCVFCKHSGRDERGALKDGLCVWRAEETGRRGRKRGQRGGERERGSRTTDTLWWTWTKTLVNMPQGRPWKRDEREKIIEADISNLLYIYEERRVIHRAREKLIKSAHLHNQLNHPEMSDSSLEDNKGIPNQQSCFLLIKSDQFSHALFVVLFSLFPISVMTLIFMWGQACCLLRHELTDHGKQALQHGDRHTTLHSLH